jgi:phosphatidylinositol alpha-1,6-mannosyltransferase
MNILILAFEFPPAAGGMGQYAYQIAKNLYSYGHNVTAVVAYENFSQKNYNNFIKSVPFKIERFRNFNGRTINVLLSFGFFRNLVLKNQPDIIIVATPNAAILGYSFKKLYNIPYVIIGHGSEFLPLNFLHDLQIRLFYSFSDLIIPNSNFTKKLIEKTSISNKNITVINPGADDLLYDYKKYPRNELDKKVILSVGALSIRKGHKHVIDAVEVLSNRLEKFEYWIIGKGPEEANIKEYIKNKKLENYVKLIGFVPTKELPIYYSRADIFILNSSDNDPFQVEGFGIVLIEANLMGIPVIGSKNSGMEDAIENGFNGFLIDTKNPQEIAETIKILLSDDKKARKMGLNGYTRAKAKFTWKITVEQINSHLEKHKN